MKHIQNFESYNESIKDYLVAGAIAASTALSSPKEVKASEKEKIEYTKGKDVQVEFTKLDTVSFQHSHTGIYDLRKSSNIDDVIVYNEIPKTENLSEENTIKFIVKTKIKNNQYPYDIKVVNKKMDYQPGWGMNEDFPKMYLIPFLFEEDEERKEDFVFSEITISNLKKGRYSFTVNGNVIKFEVK